MILPDFISENEKNALIAELKQLGIKHNSEQIVRIAKRKDGKIIFLEEGKKEPKGRGLAHIIEIHKDDFREQNISEEQIPDVIMTAILHGKIIGYQGKLSKTPRIIYEFTFNEEIKYIAITISDNGYIVGANPRAKPRQ